MGFYENHILPHMINSGCGVKPVRKQREKVVPLAEGRVLEVGMGSGHNIEHYNPDKVEMVWGLEPSEGMRKKAWPR
ncbi:MAG: SAM-dependent methyltransferase, partial [Gammaproteobacteria bacterium]|nr:SAM-dependent methyltransferase [Gammaproteobacteria bacterium]